ncbi:MAG: iron ABC transporter permease [Rhodospirillaceae bacterium]|nr:iron ABC transporter permease [Rhodospirillaceae bacterium]MBT3491974.1 iron ABC transporter permease [Rhodospirillaceae bacterium]MBT3779234.1 iron ABC transporter permease [Rhodospirillaceae bacterium]MBT4169393.1 iron ABC transporter permease [Rhodospirillaceae bacterium]MBT4561910.1 iron ABC transporter permease [Rhodospirillaceae bacterium]
MNAPRPRRRGGHWLDGWTVATIVIAALATVPIFAVIYLALTPSENIWPHLVSTVLSGYISTTLILMAGVGLGTLLIGVGTAWLVTMCRFPGRRLFEWGMLLPMAMPAYIIAYVYTDILEYAGPVQAALRELFGWSGKQEYWFPEIRSLGGAIAMMTLVLYPYVYLLARASFLEQSVGVFEASRSLGRGPWRSFFSVALPLARPGIVIGLSLVLMETLNDFGTVDFFAVNTFSLGIFDVWMNMNNVSGAAQLATVMLLFVAFLVFSERYARRRQRFHNTSSKFQALPGFQLVGGRGLAATIACLAPVLLGFVLPTLVLLRYAHQHFDPELSREILGHALNSVKLSVLAGTIAVLVAIIMAYSARIKGGKVLMVANRVAAMGYAVPGAVLAVGVMIVLGNLDNGIDGIARENFGFSTGLIFSGTIAAVTFGYLVRFLALSLGTVEASLGKVTPSMDGASRSLGRGAFATMQFVHLPLIKGGVLTAVMLVFVDCMKELPMTVILQPFNFQTLATFVHQYASDEQLGDAALAALSIVGVGVVPVILLSLTIAKSRPGHKGGE